MNLKGCLGFCSGIFWVVSILFIDEPISDSPTSDSPKSVSPIKAETENILFTANGQMEIVLPITFRPNWSIEFPNKKEYLVGDWYQIKRSNSVSLGVSKDPQIFLTNKDRLPGGILSATDRVVIWRPAWAVPKTGFSSNHEKKLNSLPQEKLSLFSESVKIPISRIGAIRFRQFRKNSGEMGNFLDQLGGQRNKDILVLVGGGKLEGTFLQWKEETKECHFQIGNEIKEIAGRDIESIFFNTNLSARPNNRVKLARISLTDGTLLHLSTLSVQKTESIARLWFNQEIRFPSDKIVSIIPESDQIVSLGTLSPIKYRSEAFLQEKYPWVSGQNCLKHPISLYIGDTVNYFEDGIGLHSQCQITYDLKNRYQNLVGLFGLDAVDGNQGSCLLQIYRDGKPLWEKPHLFQGQDNAEQLSIDVSSTNELRLELLWGRNGPIGDVFNLADPVLIKKRNGK